MKERDVANLEQVLGYAFKQRAYLEQALTHISALQGSNARLETYQRLEFLGDHILGAVIADRLFRLFPDVDEGELSRRLSGLVRAETCAEVAREAGMHFFIKMGEGEAHSGGRKKLAIQADVCEAIIAAVYLDGGMVAVSVLIERLWGKRLEEASRIERDAKTRLQEWAQGQGLEPPVYSIVSRLGPDHAPIFQVEARILGFDISMGEGRTRRDAEQQAARIFLEREERPHGG
jgi:ribonuclease III